MLDLNWLRSNEAKQLSKQSKTKAWNDFKQKYPDADLTKFTVETVFYSKGKAESYVKFIQSKDFYVSVSGSDPSYWSKSMKQALGINSNFPSYLPTVLKEN